MKKLLVTLLMMTMSMSLLVGCGGSDDKDTGKESTVNQDVDVDDADGEEEEYIDPRLDQAIDIADLDQYISEIEITVDNWEDYFAVEERTDEYDEGEHASKTFEMCLLPNGYFIGEDIKFVVNYNKTTNSTQTIPQYGPDTFVYDDVVDGKEVSVGSYDGTGLIDSAYIYDEMEDGVTTELVIEISNLTCTSVEGSLYSLQLPEDVWLDVDGKQVLYVKDVADDGAEFVLEFENTQEGLQDLWDWMK